MPERATGDNRTQLVPVMSIAQEKIMKVLMSSEQPHKLGGIFYVIPIADPREWEPFELSIPVGVS